MKASVRSLLDLTGKVSIITGGARLLGIQRAEAIAEMGGIPVLRDLGGDRAAALAREIIGVYGVQALALAGDITRAEAMSEPLSKTLAALGRVNMDILINKAAYNPKVEGADLSSAHWSRLENFPLEVWHQQLEVDLIGAFLCSQIVGGEMAGGDKGVILDIASDSPNLILYGGRL